MDHLGIIHQKITQWPEANGEAQSFIHVLKQVTTAAQVERIPWQQQLWPFLRNYRATPLSTTGKAPAEVLYGHNIKTQLPHIKMPASQSSPIQDETIHANHTQAQTNMKRYAYTDKQPPTQHSNIDVGDTALVKHQTKRTLKPINMVTASRDGHQITRNKSHLKNISKPKECIQEGEEGRIQGEGEKRIRKQQRYINNYERC